MTKRRKRLIVIIAVLLILLLLLGATILNYRATRKLAVPFVRVATESLVTAPEYLYSFSGSEEARLRHPLGVLAHGNRVYVTDSELGAVFVFSADGELDFIFGFEELTTPLYIARNPLDGNIYISDRRQRALQIFQDDGTYVGEFDPDLPPEQLPTFETGDVQWQPLAVAFDRDGSLYVTDLLASHRLLAFDPDGEFVYSTGLTGFANDPALSPDAFQFPNSVKARDGEVWVADSNNRRLKVYDSEAGVDRILPTGGLPRGIDFLVFQSEEETPTLFLVVADTLSHDMTIWAEDGERVLTFGQQGILEGEFSYPTDLSVDRNTRVFITDSSNGRVQVWGWPERITPVPAITLPPYWLWCLSPLLLLPLLLLRRRKPFFATGDFIEVMLGSELVDQMAHGKGRKLWLVMPPVYERFRDVRVEDIQLEHLLHETEHSDSDARSIMERLEIEYETAAILSVAIRAKVFCTEDATLRQYARALEVDVVDHEEYLERFGKRQQDSERSSSTND